MKANWFDTLFEALSAEQRAWDGWDGVNMMPINYGETRSFTYENDFGRIIAVSIYRSTTGSYERPITYDAGSATNG